MNPQESSPGPGPTNPYLPPHEHAGRAVPAGIELGSFASRGMVGQLPIVGTLMVVQGALVSLMAVIIGIYAAFMPRAMLAAQQQAAGQGAGAPPITPDAAFWITVVGSLFCAVTLAVGILTAIAGVRTIQMQNRTFSMAVLWAGLLTVVTCYCLPTQLALSTYGLIVLFNSPVRDAFWWVEQGHPASDVRQAYLSLPR